MHATRFDQLARGLAQRPNRRMLLGVAAGSLLGLPSLMDAGAKKRKKRKKRKKLKRRKKKCRKRGACWTFKKGKCKRKSDGAACGAGQFCQGGVCGTPPECLTRDHPCGSDAECCSNACLGPIQCGCSAEGLPCLEDFDCCDGVGLTCRGFVCHA